MVLHKLLLSFCVLLILVVTVFAQSPENEIRVNDIAPNFVLRNLEGNDVFLRDYCGDLRQPWKSKTKYVVVLSFFTSYCMPCLKEIPELEKIAARYKENDLKILLVNLKEDQKIVQQYVREKGFSLPVLLDRYGMTAQKYGVSSVPRIFIIDKDGLLIWMTKGYDEQLGENIDKCLSKAFTR